ncbi:MAG: hypothetical protein ACO1RT_16655 [Planctomycetaceae bacterium]
MAQAAEALSRRQTFRNQAFSEQFKIEKADPMVKHEVAFSIPKRALGRADVQFTIKADGGVLGTLTISNGSLVWFAKGTTKGCKMGWKRFDRIMQEYSLRREDR